MKTFASALAALLWMLSACSKLPPPRHVVTITAAGVAPTVSIVCSNLPTIGNFGLGELTDGKLLVNTGRYFSVAKDGAVAELPTSVVARTATMLFFEADRFYDVADMDFAQFRRTLDWKRPAPGRVYAIRVAGAFSRLRLVGGRELSEARGLMIGFFAPDYLRSLFAPGYELYFLSADERTGGEVADFAIRQARIDLSECVELRCGLPEQI